MKRPSFVTMSMIVLVSAFCLITWNSQAWAKGRAGKSKTSQPSVTEIVITKPFDQSSSRLFQKKSSGDNYQKEPGSLEFPNIK